MTPGAALVARAYDIALTQEGVMEVGGANRGPQVDEYLKSVGLDPTRGSYPWCYAALYWCFQKAAHEMGMKNPLPKTAKVVRAWQLTPDHFHLEAPVDLAIFIRLSNPDDPNTSGHCGFVKRNGVFVGAPGTLATLEANTNAAGSREGNQFLSKWRPISYCAGFLDFSREPAPILVG